MSLPPHPQICDSTSPDKPHSARESSWFLWGVFRCLTHSCIPTGPSNQTQPLGSAQKTSLDSVNGCTSPYPLLCLCTWMSTVCVCVCVCVCVYTRVHVCMCVSVSVWVTISCQQISVHKWTDFCFAASLPSPQTFLSYLSLECRSHVRFQ